MAEEAADVAALARELGTPLLLVGHSSGGVAALEALVAAPELFTGALLFDPAVTIRDDPWDEPLARARARAAVADGKPGRAMRIFAREVLRLPAPLAWLGDAYAAIPTPVLLLRGEKSGALARERNDALAAVLPDAEQAVLPGQPHDANRTAPDAVAARIEAFYRRLLDG